MTLTQHIRTGSLPGWLADAPWPETEPDPVDTRGSIDPVAAEQASRSGWGELDEADDSRDGETMWGLERDHPWLLWLYPAAATLVAMVGIAQANGWLWW
jgi:hypothetical protein